MVVSFIMSKSRLAPLCQSLTIAELELQAAVVAVRMKSVVLEQIECTNVTFWTDSKTVLKYVRNENWRFQSFVMHRVSEIRKNSRICDWKYIPTKLNLADECTRLAHNYWNQSVGSMDLNFFMTKATARIWSRITVRILFSRKKGRKEFVLLQQN